MGQTGGWTLVPPGLMWRRWGENQMSQEHVKVLLMWSLSSTNLWRETSEGGYMCLLLTLYVHPTHCSFDDHIPRQTLTWVVTQTSQYPLKHSSFVHSWSFTVLFIYSLQVTELFNFSANTQDVENLNARNTPKSEARWTQIYFVFGYLSCTVSLIKGCTKLQCKHASNPIKLELNGCSTGT